MITEERKVSVIMRLRVPDTWWAVVLPTTAGESSDLIIAMFCGPGRAHDYVKSFIEDSASFTEGQKASMRILEVTGSDSI